MKVIELNSISIQDIMALEIDGMPTLVVYIPLDSIGMTSDYSDICEDYLEAIWVAECLTAEAEHVQVTQEYIPETHKTRLCLTIHKPFIKIKSVLYEAYLLYNINADDNESNQQLLDEISGRIIDFENVIDTYPTKIPEVVDRYFANLVGGVYFQMRYDAPEIYQREIAEHPERRIGYWRSSFSSKLGASCYASSDGWVLPNSVNLNDFFLISSQKYNAESMRPAKVMTINNTSYILSEDIVAYFPMSHYFKSRICSSLALLEEEDVWPPDTFNWLDASFSYSPYHEFLSSAIPENSRATQSRIDECLIDPDGTIIIINDGSFRHLLYDTKTLTLDRIRKLYNDVVEESNHLANNIGLANNINYQWASLTDEQFEQLCYDLICVHPKFNSETIRKYGKSRSRDGGRDIEVYDIPRSIGDKPRKWIFQCKLITSSKSLSSTKLIDVGDMLDHYGAEGFGVMTSAPIDATLYDKLDAICGRRGVEQMNFSIFELERTLSRHNKLHQRYFGD
ncbi:Uncharacterised protein [Klebsiella pneumoniae]|uniref:hypothetical protein n=1 Tax=Klebsiella pneumoniae TaxID=573 RepID=UPI000E2DB5C0|nr:hypothetical protein [Klebsiella pneumoniae]MEB5546560.1 hypothetical protein [Klebsiella pneumoniae]SWU13217.1 Uncharacterised protein [Klebsiella pneumoniae]SWY69814.1 Uncharacterised protein [Klebsiella pneumoniae]SXA77674.1 Uncharacterised protein [Klebsiella pneumoniae]VAN65889.1 Uncharacterised protein [Klebsiella pneumoniae]